MKKDLKNIGSKNDLPVKNITGKWLFRIYIIFLLLINLLALGLNSPFVKNKIAFGILDFIESKTGFSASL